MTKSLSALATDKPGDPAVAWYNGLPAPVRALVDECVRDLVTAPRMARKGFGPQSALELVYKVYLRWAALTPQKAVTA